MATLEAASMDDGDEIGKASTPSPATNTSPSTAVVTSRSNHVNGIENDPQTSALEEHSSDEISVYGTPTQDLETDQDDHIDLQVSPNLPPDTDNDEEEEEEEEETKEEHPQKKQKQLPEFPKPEPSELEITNVPLTENGKPSKSGKKSKKKKNKDVWSTTSRKGRKKTKHAASNNNHNGDTEDKVLITPIPRFPDKSDDSPDLNICLSKVYKAEKVELSDDRLTAGSTKGYRMVRATRGVTDGAWYYEIKVVHLGESGHTRMGWSTEKGDLQAPVGYDGNSFGYRDVDGSKVHKALREKYGDEGYKEGDVIGFYINLPDGESYAPNPPRFVWYKGQRFSCALDGKEDSDKVVPGSEIAYYKNGICQGVAFKDLYGGRYYPAASMYTLPNQPNCVVKFNFGPDFERFPDDFGDRPFPRPMIEVPYQSYDGRVDNNVSNEKKQ